jgi:hypothetical protein
VQLTTDEDLGYWSTNGSSWDNFSGTTAFINITVGTPYLLMYGKDQYANISTVATNDYTWDQTAPVVSIINGPTGNVTNNSDFTITLTNSEENGYWSTNGSQWTSFNPSTILTVTAGTPYLIFYGKDVHGNVSAANTNNYTWDLSAPVVSIISTPAGDYTTNTAFDVQFSTTEANGYWSTNEGAAWTGFAVGTTVTIENGTSSLMYYGEDVYGNISSTNSNVYAWDVSAPAVSIISGPAGHYTNNAAFDVPLTNEEAFGYYTTNGTLWTQFDPDVTVSIKLGTPYLMFYGKDIYGNMSVLQSNDYYWDTAFPVVTVGSGPAGSLTTNQSFSITLSSTKPDGYWSTNTGGAWNSFAVSDTGRT